MDPAFAEFLYKIIIYIWLSLACLFICFLILSFFVFILDRKVIGQEKKHKDLEKKHKDLVKKHENLVQEINLEPWNEEEE